MLNEVKAKIKYALKRCPVCAGKLDKKHHGFNKDYRHCHNCGFCTYEIYAEEMKK